MTVIVGDCVEALRELASDSVDACVTDPPYGIGFMGHEWDQPGIVGKMNGTPAEPFKREGVPKGQRRVANPKPSGIGRDGHAMEAGRYDMSRTANQAFQAWCEVWAREVLRVLKPGGFLLVFGGSRTYHRLGCAVEDAGFEMRDSIHWLFGSGFPKSLNVSKSIDKAKGVVGESRPYVAPGGENIETTLNNWGEHGRREQSGPYDSASDEARQWEGWGTALKPAHEPVVVARKPLIGAVAANVLEHGTGAMNIDGCRVASTEENPAIARRRGATSHLANGRKAAETEAEGRLVSRQSPEAYSAERPGEALGRWPANVVLTHSEGCVLLGTRRVKAITGTASGRMGPDYQSGVYGGYTKDDERFGEPTGYGDEDGMETVEAWECTEGCPVRLLDEQTGTLRSGAEPASGFRRNAPKDREGIYGGGRGLWKDDQEAGRLYGDEGGASRFFYCGKSSRAERNAGLEDFEAKPISWSSGEQNAGSFQADGTDRSAKNFHPTVKPLDLMRWLVRLVTPPGGLVLDPFTGSGTTGCAASLEGFEFTGIERDAEYAKIAEARIRFWASKPEGIETERVLRAEAARPERTGQLGLL